MLNRSRGPLAHSPDTLDAESARNREWAKQGTLILLVTLAAILRFAALGRQPLWLDEATDVAFAKQSLWNCVFAEVVHPPLYRVLLHFVVVHFGDSAVAMRFLPAVFGILAVPAVALLVRRLFPTAELTSTALVATSPFLIYFSQENRDYSLFILLTILATWSFWRFCESGRGLALYGGLALLLLYTHNLAFFVLLAHEIVYWWRERRRIRDWVLARAAVLCVFAPWLIWTAAQYRSESRLFVPPLLLLPGTLLRFFVGYGIAASDAVRKTESLRSKIVAEGPVAVPSFCLCLWMLWRGARRALVGTSARILFAGMLLIPWATLVILAPWLRLTQERYFAFQAPFILMLIAAGLGSLPEPGRFFASAMLALVIAFSLTSYYRAPGSAFGYRFLYGKENWAGAAAFVRQQRADTVILAPGYLNLPFDRYPRGESREIQTRGDSFAPPDLHYARRVALVLSHTGPAEDRLRGRLDAIYPQIAQAIFPAQDMIRVVVYDASAPLPSDGNTQLLH
jgi:uncharacterized membrane protein